MADFQEGNCSWKHAPKERGNRNGPEKWSETNIRAPQRTLKEHQLMFPNRSPAPRRVFKG